MPQIRVVFNEPVHIAVAVPPPPPTQMQTGANETSKEDSGLLLPWQLTDPPYSLGRTIQGYDARRSALLAKHPEFPARMVPAERPRVLVVTGSAPAWCPDPDGDYLLLRTFKNKMSGFWEKLPLLRMLMVAHPETELIWWVDSNMVFTDMMFQITWERYAAHNLVLYG
uniref:Uncharacterized protein n=1 Tax=Oryza punctata TaxID=4537 RepID=A0A0E0MFI7_ORYPU